MPPRKQAANDYSRKLGDQRETITTNLSPTEIEEEKGKVMDLLNRRDNLVGAVKAVKAEYKAKIDIVDEKLAVARRAAGSGKRDDEVDVEEWLTKGNEVVRIRLDTGEILDRRTATMAELQETMFDDTGKDGFPSSKEAFGND